MGTEGILDDTDLRTIRDALAAGKQVKLLPDGSVEASADVVDAPMGAQAEAYIESQLGDVKALLEKGF
jgi:nicotinamidase-related amidase